MRLAICVLSITACTVGSGTNRTPITQRLADACEELSSLCTASGDCVPQQTFCGADGTRFLPVFLVEDTCKNGCSGDISCLKTCKQTRVDQITTTLATSNAVDPAACTDLAQACLGGSGCTAREFFCLAAAPPASPCSMQLDACKAACAPHDRDCLRACRAAYRQCLSGSPMPDGGMTTYNLTYATSGTGTGTVAVNPAGTSCGANCATYDANTMVTLTATASAGSTFGGWTGCTSTTNTCTVTMTKSLTVTAAFATQTTTTYNLTYATAGTGSGTVAVNPAGASCGANCATYDANTAVTLTATASSGSTFASWTGCTSTTNSCTVTMTKALTVTATFTLNPPAVSLANDVQPILTAHCAGCHSGGTAPNLSAGRTYASTVNVTAGGCSTAKYVVPAQPAQSYLVTTLTSGGSLGGCNGGSMAGFLGSSADLTTIKTWISQGALNN